MPQSITLAPTPQHGRYDFLQSNSLPNSRRRVLVAALWAIGLFVLIAMMHRFEDASGRAPHILLDGLSCAVAAAAFYLIFHRPDHRQLNAYAEGLREHIDVVREGALACERVAAQRFDAVLMDLQMPDIDGFEATRRIRQVEAGKGPRIPIIALSASVLPEERQRCLDAGMDEHLPKPVSIADLRRALDRWCGQSACPAGAPRSDAA